MLKGKPRQRWLCEKGILQLRKPQRLLTIKKKFRTEWSIEDRESTNMSPMKDKLKVT